MKSGGFLHSQHMASNWTIKKSRTKIPTLYQSISPISNGMIRREEKWVTLSNDALSLMQLLDVDVDMLKGEKIEEKDNGHFTHGSIYALTTDRVEGMDFGNIYFRIYGVVRDYKGVALNSVIAKEVVVDDEGNIIEGLNPTGRRKFSIPPAMCKMLGIEYSPGFELWPMDSGFVRVDTDDLTEKEEPEINYGNLSTYPTSEIDGTIRKIILEIHGFSPYNTTHIITPTGAMIPTSDFLDSLTVFTRQNISTDNGCAGFLINETLPFKIVGRDNGNKVFSICDSNHNIYLEVDLRKQSYNANTSDGFVGVAHTALDGKDIDDVIGVKWDESNDANRKDNTPVEIDVDSVFDALDKHFNRMNDMFSGKGYWNGMKVLEY